MSASLKLISLNVEHKKHLDTIVPFLAEHDADVVCLQEVMESSIPHFKEAAGATAHFFAPMLKHYAYEYEIMGTLILSRLPAHNETVEYYYNDREHLPLHDVSTPERQAATMSSSVLRAVITKGETAFTIATTHFTWSPQGIATDLQRSNMQTLLALLEKMGEFVLTGDFNIPRGGEIYTMLASHYADNIPSEYTTSIDINLHRAGRTNPDELATKMVDYIFSTPSYSISDVELVSGVSDHRAVVANVSRIS